MHGGGYGSEFDDGNGTSKRKRSDAIGFYEKDGRRNFYSSSLPPKSQLLDSYEHEQQRLDFAKFKSLNAYDRHKKLMHDYLMYYGGKMEDLTKKHTSAKTDLDVIKENHRFVWDEEDGAEETWGQKLAKKYHDKLFKEYCISDLSRYKQNQFAMRWRTENEVHIGKGQFSCGAKKCEDNKGLKTWEVNFGYIEHGEKKNTLIKLRLCPDCSYMLNYHRKHKQLKRKRDNKKRKGKKKKKKKKHKRRKDSESSSSDDNSTDSEADTASKDTLDSSGTSTSDNNSLVETSIWKQPIEVSTEKTQNELFDDYLEDLFM